MDVSSTQPADARSDVEQHPVSDAPTADVPYDTASASLDSSARPDVVRDAPLCQPGARDCAGNQPVVCDVQGNWIDIGAPCSGLCIAGYCAECIEGLRQCNGFVVQGCVNGTWMNLTVCAFRCAAGNCTGICQPGATRCSVEGSQVCSALGEWQTVDGGCPSPATDAGDDGG